MTTIAAPYSCCFHCSCPTSDGHPVPCVRCQAPRVTADQLVARAMNRGDKGGGVNTAPGMPVKDAPMDETISSSGVPAPPPAPAISWSAPPPLTVDERRWWRLRARKHA